MVAQPMALEDYTFRVKELSPAGEMIRTFAYLHHPIVAYPTGLSHD
jgi:hypothetical protein